MAKIVALDVGAKRTGVAESDAMHMMAFPLETVQTEYVLMSVSYTHLTLPTILLV